MIEDVFLEDLKSRGIEVNRNCAFIKCTPQSSENVIDSTCRDVPRSRSRIFRSKIVVGCDGAHSQVRKSMSRVVMEGESGKAAWGVLDGK